MAKYKIIGLPKAQFGPPQEAPKPIINPLLTPSKIKPPTKKLPNKGLVLPEDPNLKYSETTRKVAQNYMGARDLNQVAANMDRVGKLKEVAAKNIMSDMDVSYDRAKQIVNSQDFDLEGYTKKKAYEDLERGVAGDEILTNYDENDPRHVSFGAPEDPSLLDYAGRVWDVASNPLDAFQYSVTGDLSDMPYNMRKYEDYKSRYNIEDETDQNLVNETLDFASWFTGPGAIAQGIKMLPQTGESVYNLIQDPSLASAGNAALNVGFNALALSPVGKLVGTRSALVNPASRYAAYAKLPLNTQMMYGNPYLQEAESIINLPGFKLAKGKLPGQAAQEVSGNIKNMSLGELSLLGAPVKNLTPGLIDTEVQLRRGEALENIAAIAPLEAEIPNLTKLTDDELAASIVDDMRANKIELWQTEEGQQRLQKMIDNTPSLKGQTPQSMIEGMASMNNLTRMYSNQVRTIEDAKKQIDYFTTFYDSGKMSSAQYMDLTADLENKINMAETNLSQLEEVLNSNKAAYYDPTMQELWMNPEKFSKGDYKKVTAHELGHFLGSYGPREPGATYLDDELKNLKLVKAEQLEIPGLDIVSEESAAHSLFGTATPDYLKVTLDYFNKGSRGTERVPFLAEVRQDMLDKGIIKSEYQPITENLLKKHYKDYKNTRGEKYPLRLYDIIENDPKNFSILKKVLNNLPVIAAIGSMVAEDSDSNIDEASINPIMMLLAAALLKNPKLKFPNKLKNLVKDYSTKGISAINSLNKAKYLLQEARKLEETNKVLLKEVGSIFEGTGLDYKIRELEEVIRNKTIKAEDYFYRKLGTKASDLQNKLDKKRADLFTYQEEVKNVKKTEEGLTKIQPSVFKGVTTTGEKVITDFNTGNKVPVKIELPQKEVKYKIIDGEIVSSEALAKEFVTTPNYVSTLKGNIEKTKETVPGGIIFGSSLLVTEAGMPHITDDLDLLIKESDYNKNVKDKFRYVKDKGPAKQHAVFPEYGEEGTLDFNIIHENPDGTVKIKWQVDPITGEETALELELFRQFYPDEFQKASTESILKNKPIKINMNIDKFLEKIDPFEKTVIDSYEAGVTTKFGDTKPGKEKHHLRPDVLISYGTPKAVAKGQEAYIKSVVGSKGTLGYQFSTEQLSDVNKNFDTLLAMNFKGDDLMKVASDPERMQLALNDYYINNTVFSREIDIQGIIDFAGKINEELLRNALTEWQPGLGQSTHGMGLNTVRKGTSVWENNPATAVIGHRQIGIPLDVTNPETYVNSIIRGTSGTYVFTPDELTQVKEIFNKYLPEYKTQIDQIQKSRDLLEIKGDGEAKIRGKKAFDEMADVMGIRAIAKDLEGYEGSFGNSVYASLFGKFDDLVDSMVYSFKKNHVVPKSNFQRQRTFENYNIKNLSKSQIKTIEDFKKIGFLLDNGIKQTETRLNQLMKENYELSIYKTRLINKAIDFEKQKELNELRKKSDDIKTQITANRELQQMLLKQRDDYQNKLRKSGLPISIIALAGLGLGTIAYVDSENEKFEKELKERERAENILKSIRNIDIPTLKSTMPTKALNYLYEHPESKYWPTGERITINYDGYVYVPETLVIKDDKVQWDMPKKRSGTKNKKAMGGENMINLELTRDEINDLVSKGYIVVEK